MGAGAIQNWGGGVGWQLVVNVRHAVLRVGFLPACPFGLKQRWRFPAHPGFAARLRVSKPPPRATLKLVCAWSTHPCLRGAPPLLEWARRGGWCTPVRQTAPGRPPPNVVYPVPPEADTPRVYFQNLFGVKLSR